MTGTLQLATHQRESRRVWLRPIQRVAAPRLRLVCFPHAGGAASFYRGWPEWLAPDVEAGAVRYPGREDRILEPCIDTMAELADRIAEALAPSLDRPLVLFGHSMGASVAHEVALRLEARFGPVVARLIVSCRAAAPRLRPRGISGWSDAQLLAHLRSLGGDVSAVLEHPEMRDVLLPAIRSDYRLTDAYTARTPVPLTAPVTGYLGEDDPHVTEEDMRAWSTATRGDFTLNVLPGDHFYLLPQAARVVTEIGELTAGI
ncbi:thioesterase [Streptomyces sp. ISL-99]|uniref:thioesterase II family protein n=1 Tax=Streptomyces sp. ISL-99 TaxID=2819193 RepID=UPI001BE878DB|nr:alpha/beta fold hydrolase [Streptomyces sp. ISL-99]MBT2526889.1 thioesterase [Streptomyces sp. ISL-99]